jgi:hypothetical protein
MPEMDAIDESPAERAYAQGFLDGMKAARVLVAPISVAAAQKLARATLLEPPLIPGALLAFEDAYTQAAIHTDRTTGRT